MLAVTKDIHDILADLERRLRRALRDAPEPAVGRVLSITLAAPLLKNPGIPELPQAGVYWARPGTGCLRVGMGQAAFVEARGPGRFDALQRHFAGLRRGWLRLDPDCTGLGGRAFFGFSFADGDAPSSEGTASPEARLLLPRLLLEQEEERCALTFSTAWNGSRPGQEVLEDWLDGARELTRDLDSTVAPPAQNRAAFARTGGTPSKGAWLARVERALAAIRAGLFEKVVLTRRVHLESNVPIAAAQVLRWLQAAHPDCVQFAYAAGEATLVGASPERLAEIRGRELVADVVAGTAARDADRMRDRHLGQAMLHSAKDRAEHRLVVDHVVRVLAPLCTRLMAAPEPDLLRLPNLQHLLTPVRGEVRPGVSLLQVITGLHPTPSVGGAPPDPALAWLAREGETQRGWYTGALGWLSADGTGEATVVIRCALLRGNTAELYAGAGIVAASNPRAEWAETELKLATMLQAFGVV